MKYDLQRFVFAFLLQSDMGKLHKFGSSVMCNSRGSPNIKTPSYQFGDSSCKEK